MTPYLKHSTLAFLLALGACAQTPQRASFFGDPGTELALAAAGTAASYDPTGASSFAVAKATHAALMAQAARSRVEWERHIAQDEERIRKIPDKKLRELAEANLERKKRIGGGLAAGTAR